jgi:hypothetical protein
MRIRMRRAKLTAERFRAAANESAQKLIVPRSRGVNAYDGVAFRPSLGNRDAVAPEWLELHAIPPRQPGQSLTDNQCLEGFCLLMRREGRVVGEQLIEEEDAVV